MRGRAAFSVVVILAGSRADAHAFGARYDLPLPLGFYLAAAGAAVAASFLGALAFQRSARQRLLQFDLTLPPVIERILSVLLGAAGMVILAVLLAAAFLGPGEAVRNLATVGIWVIWWVGFLLFSALVIDLWPLIDPFRRLAALTVRIADRPWERPGQGPPPVTGWLAPVGLLAIAWVELVSGWSEEPMSLGVLVLAYLAVAVFGGFVYGAAWFTVADPLGRIFELLGRLAPLARRGRGALRLRPPGEGLLANRAAPRGEVALVVGLIGIVLFDGLSETPFWAAVLDFVSQSQSLRPMLLWLRDQGLDLLKFLRTLGLFATVGVFYGLLWLLMSTMRAATGRKRSTAGLARDFASTLLPIAVAYHLSHYLSYLLIAGQLILPTASDPFGRGWDLIGKSDRSIDISVIGAEQIWWVAFTAIIAGHVLSVLVGHRRALQVFSDGRSATFSQIPLAIAMVGLTVLSLWILSQPVTE